MKLKFNNIKQEMQNEEIYNPIILDNKKNNVDILYFIKINFRHIFICCILFGINCSI